MGKAWPAPTSAPAYAEIAKRQVEARRRRDQTFPRGLFRDPAWDMLLDLFVARIEARDISVTSACIAANVPPTSALRCLAVLESCELISRTPSETDRRRSIVRMTDDGYRLMTEYLSEAVSDPSG